MLESEPMKTLREFLKTTNSLVDTLATVKDAESAKAATPKLETQYAKLSQIIDSLPELTRTHANAKVRKSELERLVKDRDEAKQRLEAELERVQRLKGLPIEFWSVVRKRGLDVAISAFSLAQTQGIGGDPEALQALQRFRDLMAQHGHPKVVNVEMTNLPSALEQKAYDKLTAAAPGATLHHFSALGKCDAVFGPVADYKAVLAAASSFGTVQFEDEGQRSIKLEVDRRKLGARANSDAEETQLSSQDAQRRDEENRRRAEAEEAEMAKQGRSRLGANRDLDSSQPDYYEKLAERMTSQWRDVQSDALDKLLRADPLTAESAARKKIAQNFKELAFNGHGDEQRKGIEGMAKWGGKFSVPLLLELLEQHGAPKESIYNALGDLKDERAAVPVATKLNDFFDRSHAHNCLRRMGPAAEAGLIQVAPSNDARVCLIAIELLGECGSGKAIPTLREAQKSRNLQVREAAKLAVRKIRERQKQAKEEGAEEPASPQ